MPDIDPARPSESLLADRIDRLDAATYELGSVMKVFTVAMALDMKLATPATVLDVRVPLQVGRWTIRDLAPSGRPLTVREVLVQSSNIGAAQLALLAGAQQQRAFLTRAGLIEPMRLETGPLAAAAHARALGRGRDGHHRLWLRRGGLADAAGCRYRRAGQRRQARARRISSPPFPQSCRNRLKPTK